MEANENIRKKMMPGTLNERAEDAIEKYKNQAK